MRHQRRTNQDEGCTHIDWKLKYGDRKIYNDFLIFATKRENEKT